MKALTALALMPACLGAQSAFLDTTWGMSQAQVRAAEKAPPATVRNSGSEIFVEYASARLATLNGRMVYNFAPDRSGQAKLVRARFLPEAEHTDDNEFIRDFHTIESELRERYGKPLQDRTVWTDDSTQDEPKSYLEQDRATATGILPSDRYVGLAVLLGHLRLYTQRSVQHNGSPTRIWHTLWGEDHQIAHQVEYQSIALRFLEKSAPVLPLRQ